MADRPAEQFLPPCDNVEVSKNPGDETAVSAGESGVPVTTDVAHSTSAYTINGCTAPAGSISPSTSDAPAAAANRSSSSSSSDGATADVGIEDGNSIVDVDEHKYAVLDPVLCRQMDANSRSTVSTANVEKRTTTTSIPDSSASSLFDFSSAGASLSSDASSADVAGNDDRDSRLVLDADGYAVLDPTFCRQLLTEDHSMSGLTNGTSASVLPSDAAQDPAKTGTDSATDASSDDEDCDACGGAVGGAEAWAVAAGADCGLRRKASVDYRDCRVRAIDGDSSSRHFFDTGNQYEQLLIRSRSSITREDDDNFEQFVSVLAADGERRYGHGPQQQQQQQHQHYQSLVGPSTGASGRRRSAGDGAWHDRSAFDVDDESDSDDVDQNEPFWQSVVRRPSLPLVAAADERRWDLDDDDCDLQQEQQWRRRDACRCGREHPSSSRFNFDFDCDDQDDNTTVGRSSMRPPRLVAHEQNASRARSRGGNGIESSHLPHTDFSAADPPDDELVEPLDDHAFLPPRETTKTTTSPSKSASRHSSSSSDPDYEKLGARPRRPGGSASSSTRRVSTSLRQTPPELPPVPAGRVRHRPFLSPSRQQSRNERRRLRRESTVKKNLPHLSSRQIRYDKPGDVAGGVLSVMNTYGLNALQHICDQTYNIMVTTFVIPSWTSGGDEAECVLGFAMAGLCGRWFAAARIRIRRRTEEAGEPGVLVVEEEHQYERLQFDGGSSRRVHWTMHRMAERMWDAVTRRFRSQSRRVGPLPIPPSDVDDAATGTAVPELPTRELLAPPVGLTSSGAPRPGRNAPAPDRLEPVVAASSSDVDFRSTLDDGSRQADPMSTVDTPTINTASRVDVVAPKLPSSEEHGGDGSRSDSNAPADQPGRSALSGDGGH